MELYWDYNGKSIFGYVWGFPIHGATPSHHPCYFFGFSIYEPSSNWGTPMTLPVVEVSGPIEVHTSDRQVICEKQLDRPVVKSIPISKVKLKQRHL